MSVRLMVLGLLVQAPNHGYEIQRLLEQSQTSRWAKVLPGSVYHALKQMDREGLVEVVGVEHGGRRPRSIYAVTERGRGAYLMELRDAWRRLPDSLPSALYVALSHWQDLPPGEVLEAIDGMLERLRGERDRWDQGERAKAAAMAMPAWLRALFRNGRDHYDADIRLLESLRDEVARRAGGAAPAV
ncbi:MAG: PadR family transcriptional regulator [Nannocystaceae bacterium]